MLISARLWLPTFETRDLPQPALNHQGLAFIHLYSRHPFDSGSLLQIKWLLIFVVWQGSRPSKLSPNLRVHISKLQRVHTCALRLEYLKQRSFSEFLTKFTVRFSSGWTVNCPGRIYTYWINATSWRTNGLVYGWLRGLATNLVNKYLTE